MNGKRKPELKEIIALLQECWPAKIVARSQIGKLTGGLISPKTIANDDSLGCGISERFRIGNRIAYTINNVAQYMLDRGLIIEKKEKIKLK